MRRKFLKVFAFIMAFILFISCPLSVYASEKWEGSLGLTLYYNKDKILQYFKDTGEFWLYAASQAGAILTADFVKFAENKKKMDDILSEGNKIGVYVDENDNAKGVYFSKEFMAELKALIEQYAKENEPYFFAYPLTPDELLGNNNPGGKLMYETAKNLIDDSPSGIIAFGANYRRPYEMYFVDIGHDFRNISPVGSSSFSDSELYFYNNDTWGMSSYEAYKTVINPDGNPIKTTEEFVSNATITYDYGTDTHYGICNSFIVYLKSPPVSWSYSCDGPTIQLRLFTKEKRRIRIFKSYADMQNFTLGKRNVYYTSDYYNYVPEDLSVSIDDLQKTVDDLSKVIDQLLDQISKDTDESEIEELLRQILEALKNQQGGGGGTGGGDVNVDIDLSTTNGLLSKILAKVTQIFEKMNAAVEDAEDAALAKIQESLDEIIVQLKKIKRWTAVDTVIDGVDAIADWLDLIRGVLKDAEEGAGSAVATIASAVGDSVDTMSRKFPFSIPWDILFFVSVLSAEPQVPHFEIPFNIELSMLDITIDYTMELDFTQLQWLSDLSRLLLSMTYAVGLMRMTFGVTSAGKEE